jgi:hypothetical protein
MYAQLSCWFERPRGIFPREGNTKYLLKKMGNPKIPPSNAEKPRKRGKFG